jgi:hypothetical protein
MGHNGLIFILRHQFVAIQKISREKKKLLGEKIISRGRKLFLGEKISKTFF